MIVHEITLGKEEYDVFAELALNTPRQKRYRIIYSCIAAVFAVLLIGFGFEGFPYYFDPANIPCLVLAAVLVFMICFQKKLKRLTLRRMTAKANAKVTSGYRKYTIDGSGVAIESDFGSGSYKWSAFCGHGEYSHYIWLRRKDAQLVLIDKSRLSEQETAELDSYLKEFVK